MKKVLLLIPGYSSFLKPFKEGFKANGWETKEFDYRRGNLFIRVFRFLPLKNARLKAEEMINQKIIKLSHEYKPDIILTVKGESLKKKLLETLRSQGNLVVNYFPDPMNYWEFMIKNTPLYDFFIHFDPMIVEKLRKKGNKNIFYLPFAAEIGKKRVYKKELDISFVGTYSAFREKYLSVLKDLNLNIWGDPRWFHSSLKEHVREGRISQREMKEVIKHSKINVNLIFDAPKEGTNLRTFEVTGFGGFLLTEYVKDLDRLFKVGKEVESFKSPKELRQKVLRYLEDNKSREEIAERGYKRAKKDHNYKKRVLEFLNIIDGK